MPNKATFNCCKNNVSTHCIYCLQLTCRSHTSSPRRSITEQYIKCAHWGGYINAIPRGLRPHA